MALLCICNISPPSQLPAHPPEAYLDSWSKTTLKPCPSSNKATSYSTAQKDLKTFWKWLLSLGLAVHLPTVHHAASRRLPHLPSAAAQQQWSSNTTAAWNVKGELKAEGCSPKLCREGQASFFSLQTGWGISTRHLLHRSRTRLSSTHYLLMVCFCFYRSRQPCFLFSLLPFKWILGYSVCKYLQGSTNGYQSTASYHFHLHMWYTQSVGVYIYGNCSDIFRMAD